MPNEENIKPFEWKPGQSGNPNGRPKGRKSLATIVRELEAEDFDWDKLPIKGNNDEGKAMLSFFKDLGSPWRALVMRAMMDSMTGDKSARAWFLNGTSLKGLAKSKFTNPTYIFEGLV